MLAYGLIFIFQKRLAGKSESINKKSFFLAHSFSLSVAHLMQLTILSHSHPSIVFHNSYSYSDSRVLLRPFPCPSIPWNPYPKHYTNVNILHTSLFTVEYRWRKHIIMLTHLILNSWLLNWSSPFFGAFFLPLLEQMLENTQILSLASLHFQLLTLLPISPRREVRTVSYSFCHTHKPSSSVVVSSANIINMYKFSVHLFKAKSSTASSYQLKDKTLAIFLLNHSHQYTST